MIERIKTGTLWLLILLSIFLTIQIWTFQPNYAILKSTEYIDNTQIGEEKKLQQVIRPKQVVVHHEGGHYFSPLDSFDFIDHFFEEYSGAVLEQFILLPNIQTFSRHESGSKIEFIFPTSIPAEAIKEIFQISGNQVFIDSVDRIVLFLTSEQGKEQIDVKLISNDAQMVVQAQTNISVSKFKEDIQVESNDAYYKVFPYDVKLFGNGFKKTVYLPLESHYVNSVTYLAKPIPTEHFKQVLFSDPNFVKQYLQSNGEESFTDGNRMVNILQGGNVLRYINPTIGDLIERGNKHILYSALDFLNAHGGFTNSFYYDSTKSFGSTEEVIFDS
ncbi:hypothetical protein H1D32_21255 [Anaerobacillus sp. CMMVII]|nr:hypothetical protein [Anaerobacillus sp. CMMVII]